MSALRHLSKPTCSVLFRDCRQNILRTSTAGLISVNSHHAHELTSRAKPWDYEKYGYHAPYAFFDSTFKRFNQNTKVIVVEGNIGIDKNAFAKKVADEFGMKFIPQFTCESLYKLPNGQDLRDFNSIVPPHLKFWDFEKIYSAKSPAEARSCSTTHKHLFQAKFMRYFCAIQHIMNTGNVDR